MSLVTAQFSYVIWDPHAELLIFYFLGGSGGLGAGVAGAAGLGAGAAGAAGLGAGAVAGGVGALAISASTRRIISVVISATGST